MSYTPLSPRSLKAALAKARKLAGYSQRQVEEILNLRHLRVYDYESGRLKLPVDHAVELANLYGCNLETVLGLEASTESDDSISKLFPLLNAGLMQDAHFKKVQLIAQDPVIQSETQLYDYQEQKPIVEVVLDTLSEKQRRTATIELLKYVNSLIGIDSKVSKGEAVFRDNLKTGFSLDLSEAESLGIKKALTKEFFGPQSQAIFKTKALRHLLIWILILCAYSDDQVNPKEHDYIKRVCAHIGLPLGDFEYITRKVENYRNNK